MRDGIIDILYKPGKVFGVATLFPLVFFSYYVKEVFVFTSSLNVSVAFKHSRNIVGTFKKFFILLIFFFLHHDFFYVIPRKLLIDVL